MDTLIINSLDDFIFDSNSLLFIYRISFGQLLFEYNKSFNIISPYKHPFTINNINYDKILTLIGGIDIHFTTLYNNLIAKGFLYNPNNLILKLKSKKYYNISKFYYCQECLEWNTKEHNFHL